jgi:hypothetical protein
MHISYDIQFYHSFWWNSILKYCWLFTTICCTINMTGDHTHTLPLQSIQPLRLSEPVSWPVRALENCIIKSTVRYAFLAYSHSWYQIVPSYKVFAMKFPRTSHGLCTQSMVRVPVILRGQPCHCHPWSWWLTNEQGWLSAACPVEQKVYLGTACSCLSVHPTFVPIPICSLPIHLLSEHSSGDQDLVCRCGKVCWGDYMDILFIVDCGVFFLKFGSASVSKSLSLWFPSVYSPLADHLGWCVFI